MFHVVALATLLAAAPSSDVALVLDPSSHLSVDGDSNMHAWSCTAPLRELRIAGDPPASLRGLDATLPVEALACGEPVMDARLRDALKSKAQPQVTFHLTDYRPGAAAEGITFFRAVGVLTVAGVSRRVTLSGTAQRDGQLVEARGSVVLRMTDFGVRPPTALMGLLHTRDRVTVRFILRGQLIPAAKAR